MKAYVSFTLPEGEEMPEIPGVAFVMPPDTLTSDIDLDPLKRLAYIWDVAFEILNESCDAILIGAHWWKSITTNVIVGLAGMLGLRTMLWDGSTIRAFAVNPGPDLMLGHMRETQGALMAEAQRRQEEDEAAEAAEKEQDEQEEA